MKLAPRVCFSPREIRAEQGASRKGGRDLLSFPVDAARFLRFPRRRAIASRQSAPARLVPGVETVARPRRLAKHTGSGVAVAVATARRRRTRPSPCSQRRPVGPPRIAPRPAPRRWASDGEIPSDTGRAAPNRIDQSRALRILSRGEGGGDGGQPPKPFGARAHASSLSASCSLPGDSDEITPGGCCAAAVDGRNRLR